MRAIEFAGARDEGWVIRGAATEFQHGSGTPTVVPASDTRTRPARKQA
jgi:hypothetical protein